MPLVNGATYYAAESSGCSSFRKAVKINLPSGGPAGRDKANAIEVNSYPITLTGNNLTDSGYTADITVMPEVWYKLNFSNICASSLAVNTCNATTNYRCKVNLYRGDGTVVYQGLDECNDIKAAFSGFDISTHTYLYMIITGDDTTGNYSAQVSVTSGVGPAAPTATAQSFCGSATVADLAATGTGVINWYNASTGGSALASTLALINGSTYYVSQTISGCESTRTGVTVTINSVPNVPTAVSPQNFTTGATVGELTTTTGSGLKWYDALTSGNLLPSTTTIN
jgi:hypothetical protein